MKIMVYHLTDRGFYSEINSLISGYIYAQRKGYEFQVESKDSPLYFSEGFYHYFEATPPLPPSRQDPAVERIEAKGMGCKIFNQIRSEAYTFQEKQKAFSKILTLTEPTHHKIQRKIKSLNLPRHYTALHVRRGDKIGEKKAWTSKSGQHESERYEIADYFAPLKTNKNITLSEIENVFIMTDDYKVIQEFSAFLLKLKSAIQIYTMCNPESDGHSTIDRLVEKNYFAEDEVIELLSEIEIVRKSEYFLGSFKSNLARYVKLIHDCPDNCLSVDGIWHPH
jgi:hypothetical protein